MIGSAINTDCSAIPISFNLPITKRQLTNIHSGRYGYFYVAFAAVLFAISGTAAKALFNAGVTAFELIQLRTTVALAGLLLWLGLRKRGRFRMAPAQIPFFIALGVLGIGAAQFFYLLAISKINVAAAILLHYTGPVFVALYVVGVERQKLGTISTLAIFGTLLGCYLVVGAYDVRLLTLNQGGIVAGVAAAIAFAVYSLLSARAMKRYSPWTVLLYGMLFAALLWNILHPPLSAFFRGYSPSQWGWILFIGICGTIIPFGLYFEGIKRIAPTHASITATLEPISAGIIAALFLGEHMGLLQVAGGLLVLFSILALQLTSIQR